MTGNNNHIETFIDYYSKLSVSPEYALMIKGAWGCGKSYLVQQCIKNLENGDSPIKFLYVSLYGISCVEEIETKFFQLLNPVLSSKGMVLAGRFAKGLLKGTLKIDLDDDGKPDGTTNVGMPDINLADYITDTSNCVLVFDDLERCSMELKLILGYINYFVEKDGYKVILIADEEKLKGREIDDPSRYEYVKEKLIGKVLEVEADICGVFDAFLKEIISNSDIRAILAKRKDRIIQHFSRSQYSNLRSLRKALLEFDRLWLILDEDVKVKEDLISHLLDIFIILSMEIYSGELFPEEICELIGCSTITRHMKKEKDKDELPNKFSIIEKKYDISLYETILSISEWESFFARGGVGADAINSSLKMTKYFSEENTPDWIKIWYLYDLEDGEFEALYKSVRQAYDNREYLDLGEIKHVSGLLLRFSRRNLIEKNVEEVLRECKAYVDDVFRRSLVKVDENTLEQISGFSSYANLGYSDAESDEFKEFSEYINEKIKGAEKVELEGRTNEIIQAMKDAPINLYALLCHSNHNKSPFYSRPIMRCIPANEFISLFLGIPNKAKRVVADVLFSRYEHKLLNDPILVEHVWLKEVIAGLEKEINGKAGAVSILVIEDAISRLKQALGKLEESFPEGG